MSGFVLVTGATGKQGGAVTRALVAAGTPVRALVRDPESARAQALTDLGVELVRGDLDQPETLKPALDGARGLFSIQTPDFTDLNGDTEIHRAQRLAAAAVAAGVEQVVHTSSSNSARRIDEEKWSTFLGHVFRTKALAEDALREVGARSTTILRPSAFMENFLPPSYFYAKGSTERILVAYDIDVPQAFIAVDDIGAAAAAAFAEPERFDSVELELASERLTFREAVATVARVWERPITVAENVEQALAEGMSEVFVHSQTYLSERPSPAFPEYARALGIATTSLEDWARRHRPAGV